MKLLKIEDHCLVNTENVSSITKDKSIKTQINFFMNNGIKLTSQCRSEQDRELAFKAT